METSPSKRGLRAGFTVGRVINATIGLVFFIVLLLSLVVIGSLAHLHNQLEDYPDGFNNSHICILYSKFDEGRFRYSGSYSCEAEIFGFAIIGGVALTFLVVSIARVVVAADYLFMWLIGTMMSFYYSTIIWLTAVAEAIVLAVCVIFSFVLGLLVSSGLAVTCDNVHDIYKEDNHCDQKVPDEDGIKYYRAVNSAQASVWLAFFLLGVTTIIYCIRSFIYFRRFRASHKSSEEVLLASKDQLEESSTKTV